MFAILNSFSESKRELFFFKEKQVQILMFDYMTEISSVVFL